MQVARTVSDRDTCESAVVRSTIVGNVAVTMVGFGFTAAELASARYALVSVHVAPINLLCTGHAPTALLGTSVGVGGSAVISNNIDIGNLQFIRSGDNDSNVTVILEQNLRPE